RRGLLAPQNTFIEDVIRITTNQQSHFLVCNAKIVGYPIVFCDSGFCRMTGYCRVDILHKEAVCKFMQGEQTDVNTIERFKQVLDDQMQETLEILFYRVDKSILWTKTTVTPIRNNQDAINLFLITFKDITAQKQLMEEDASKITSLGMLVRLARTVSRSMAKHPAICLINITTLQSSQDGMFPNDQSIPRYCQEVPRTPANILLHHSAFKSFWDWAILILTFYTAVMVPYNAAFQGKTMDNILVLVIDSVVDVVFFIDIMLNFHMTFVGPGGEVVSDPTVIRINYLKSWFIVDLLSCLPYDAFNAFPDATENVSNLLSALKVVRLLRLGRVARKLDQYIEYGAAVLVLLIVMFALIAHWFACIWFTIGNIEASRGVQYSWLQRLGRETEASYVKINDSDGEIIWVGGPSDAMSYASALYFTLSCMTSVGFGNVSASSEYEKLFTVCMMILGSLLYATIFGNVTTIFQQMYSSTGRYHEMLKNVKDFMKLHCVPRSLSERVIDYVISTWSINKGIDSNKVVLNYCPADLKADICVHLNRHVFSEHPAFQLASEGCLRALAVHFQLSHWAPGDMLFHQGESLDSLCFIITGSLEVVQDEQIVAILTKGDVVGDQFWKEPGINQCMANVRALTYCDLHLIKSEKLMEVLTFYQQFAISFERTLKLTYNLRKRIVFKKISDIIKEKELEEKKLDLSETHPVRKIISRFRK
ncbi:hypothetical protein HELRODRAFT_119837, partial [Helobdella robusta]|uniref:Cyclic nucleotide-binding domain-containing protein n=1 Tax=Helobdella robusta TaxID=6412 RepID=T1EGN7_HELRO